VALGEGGMRNGNLCCDQDWWIIPTRISDLSCHVLETIQMERRIAQINSHQWQYYAGSESMPDVLFSRIWVYLSVPYVRTDNFRNRSGIAIVYGTVLDCPCH